MSLTTTDFQKLEELFDRKLEQKLEEKLEQKLAPIWQRLYAIEARLDRLEARMSAVETKLDEIYELVFFTSNYIANTIDPKLSLLNQHSMELKSHDKRIEILESHK